MQPSSKAVQEESSRIHALIKQRVYNQELEGKQLSYSYVEKKNNSGTMHNDRILIVVGRDGLGYISKLDDKFVLPFQSIGRIPKQKTVIPFERIELVEIKQGSMEIKYRKDDKSKSELQSWILRMPNHKMLEDWDKIIDAGRKPAKPKLEFVNNQSQLITGQKPPAESIGIGDDPVVEKKTEVVQTSPPLQSHMTQTDPKPLPAHPPLRVPPPSTVNEERPIFTSVIGKSNDMDKEKVPPETAHGNPSRGTDPSLLASRGTPPMQSSFKQTNSVVTFHDKKAPYPFEQPQQPPEIGPSQLPNTTLFDKDRRSSIKPRPPQKPEYDSMLHSEVTRHHTHPEQPGEQWNEMLLRADDPCELVMRFRHAAVAAVTDVIDDLGLPKNLRRYHPVAPLKPDSEFAEFSLRNMTIILSFSQPKQNPTSKQPVYDQTWSRQLLSEFNNMNHIFYSTNNNGRVLVPLAVLVEYRGVISLVKASTPKDAGTTLLPSDVQDRFSSQTRIHRSIFEQVSNLRVVDAGDSNHFLLDDVSVLLPEDHLAKPFSITNRLTSGFVLKQQFSGAELYSVGSRHSVPNRRNMAEGKVVGNHESSQRLEEMVVLLMEQLENLSEVVTTSQQMEELLEQRGVPLRYLGNIAQKTNVTMVRHLCLSEVAARSCAAILRSQLQQVLKNGDALGSDLLDDRQAVIARSKQLSMNCLLSLLNTILSSSAESDLLWKIIANQADAQFGCRVQPKDITEGYFLQALAHHLGMRLRWDVYNHALEIWRKEVEYFNSDIVQEMEARCKSYDYSFSRTITEVEELLQQPTEQSVHQLIDKLHLRSSSIPEAFRLHSIDKRIRVFVSTFLSPQDSSPKSLDLYRHSHAEPLGSCDFKVLQNEIKWAAKDAPPEKPLKLCKDLTNRIVRWCGEYHPFIIELDQLFSRYYSLRGDHDNAVTLAKSALACCIKLIGSHSLRTADQYYQLGDVEQACSRRDQALGSYRKCRAIFQNEHCINTVSYGVINSKIAKLDIYYGRMGEAESALLKAIEIFKQSRESCESDLSEAIELLSRCYQVTDNWQEWRKVADQYDRQLHLIKDPLALEKTMKLVVQAKLKQTPAEGKQRALELVDKLPLRFNEENYIQGYESIKELLKKERSLSRPLQLQLESLEQLTPEVAKERLLEDWDGALPVQGTTQAQQAVGFWAALAYFMGQSFMMGCLEYS